MARKLKTFVTHLGFFELAVAAPSMKAALDAWGMKHNAFHRGVAWETDDPQITAATNAKPGTVLRRAVGTSGPFAENAELPKDFPLPAAYRKPKHAPVKPRKAPAQKLQADTTKDRAAIISFAKAKARRDRERKKEEEERRREADKRQRARDKALSRLEHAEQQHQEALARIEAEREKLDQREKAEKARWAGQRKKLEDLRDRAGD